MNHARCRSILALLLVVSIVIVGGLASAQAITHESHHAHHQKATHGTVLCSWMCAAGQAVDGIAAPLLVAQYPVAPSQHITALFFPQVALDSVATRGPPFLPAR